MRVWISGSSIPRLLSRKSGPTHWVWRKELDPMLCFADCVRYLGGTMRVCQEGESASVCITSTLYHRVQESPGGMTRGVRDTIQTHSTAAFPPWSVSLDSFWIWRTTDNVRSACLPKRFVASFCFFITTHSACFYHLDYYVIKSNGATGLNGTVAVASSACFTTH